MKVLLVSSSSGSHGGGEFYLPSLAMGLREQGAEVMTWLSDHANMDGLAKRFADSSLAIRRWAYVNTYLRPARCVGAALAHRSAVRYAAAFRQHAPDVIHLNQQNVEDGLDLIRAATLVSIPVVSTVHVTHTMRRLNAFAGAFRDAVARRMMRHSGIDFIGISPTSSADLAEFLNGDRRLCGDQPGPSGLGKASVHCVPNGVMRPLAEDRDRLRALWKIPPGHLVLGCVARIEAQKNPLFAVQMMRRLPAHVHLVWIGDGRMRGEMEWAIAEAGLRSRIHLDGWQQDAGARMAGFDVFVLPSLYEGLPLATLEAMSLGLPCVVSDVDGLRDALRNKTTGLLCPVNDDRAWNQALMALIDDPSLRRRLGQSAAAEHERRFSLQAMAKGTIDVYRTCL